MLGPREEIQACRRKRLGRVRDPDMPLVNEAEAFCSSRRRYKRPLESQSLDSLDASAATESHRHDDNARLLVERTDGLRIGNDAAPLDG